MPRPMESGSNGSRYMYPTYLVICMGISCFGRYASYTIPMDPMNGMFLQFLPPNTRGFLDAVSLYQQHHGNVRPKTLVNRRQGSTVNESNSSLDLNNKRRTTQLITFTRRSGENGSLLVTYKITYGLQHQATRLLETNNLHKSTRVKFNHRLVSPHYIHHWVAWRWGVGPKTDEQEPFGH